MFVVLKHKAAKLSLWSVCHRIDFIKAFASISVL